MILLAMLVAASTPADPLVDELSICLRMDDATTRLACLERQAHALVDAVGAGDVSLVRREALRRTRRSLFGIEGDPASALPGTPAERIETLDTAVTSATRAGNDHWIFRLAEGGRWETTEAWLVGSDPKPGTTVSIRRGSLGSYVLKTPGERSVKVRRLN